MAGLVRASDDRAQLASAGFTYVPTGASPDNVECFLCHKALDGWEEQDDPIAEHLTHSPDCGWAIVTSIEKRRDDPARQKYPLGEDMKEARRATFAGLWPHDGKKGWVCKTEKMVEAGWYYCPTADSDDFVSCPYCSLCLDGWEPKDKPLDEHRSRSPGCPFFELIAQSAVQKKPARASRASRASNSTTVSTRLSTRLSTQSNMTMASDAPSLVDATAEEGDSGMTAATMSSITSKGGKKGTKTRKAATGTKGRKARAKKSEAVGTIAPRATECEGLDVAMEDAPAQPKTVPEAKTMADTRGTKRKSEMVAPVSIAEDADTSSPDGQGPAKRRTTRSGAQPADGGLNVQKKVPVWKKLKKDALTTPPGTPMAPVASPLSNGSNAENLPPSQFSAVSPLVPAGQSRTPLATGTPTRADLEAVFVRSPTGGSENQPPSAKSSLSGVAGALSSAEKAMTVEEWIRHGAERAVERLRAECERMVGRFESQGNRAMEAIEAIPVVGGR
ncbi:MAG: hypothetical protein M1832_000885 [Thelocarpon impressellum]|nr:MAG: hypothetical protein M1832_000885 [Thelocarpon impressellum]